MAQSLLLLLGFLIAAHSARLRPNFIQATDLEGRAHCLPFGKTHNKVCASAEAEVLSTSLAVGDECLKLCRDATSRLGVLCCSLSDAGVCSASARGKVALADVGSYGISTICVPDKESPEWNQRDVTNDNLFLKRARATLGRWFERRRKENAVALRADSNWTSPAVFRAIMPNDMIQGSIADCWLISSMASLARFPRAVRRLFRQQVITQDGEYELQLYDIASHSWMSIVVNDQIPSTQGGESQMAKVTHEKEIWPLLLEKAFAKLVSRNKDVAKVHGRGYGALNYGWPGWALVTLTGFERTHQYYSTTWRGHKTWKDYIMDPSKVEQGIADGNARAWETMGGTPLSGIGQLWEKLKEVTTKGYLATATIEKGKSTKGKVSPNGEIEREDGLFEAHAYSVLGVADLVPGTPLPVCLERARIKFAPEHDKAYRDTRARMHVSSSPTIELAGFASVALNAQYSQRPFVVNGKLTYWSRHNYVLYHCSSPDDWRILDANNLKKDMGKKCLAWASSPISASLSDDALRKGWSEYLSSVWSIQPNAGVRSIEENMLNSRYRGWGVGDTVWAHEKLQGGAKHFNRLNRIKVKAIEEDGHSCDGEACVTYDVSRWREEKVPLSWVQGRRQWGIPEEHGVRPGWKLVASFIEGGFTTWEFEGVVDQAACLDPGDRQTRMSSQEIRSVIDHTRLVRVRNPWGDGRRYNGPWSDFDTSTWKKHADVADALAFDPAPDGAWWMSFERFEKAFNSVTITPFAMANFDPPPPECNTDWGATQYLPYSGHREPLQWDNKPSEDECAWCGFREQNWEWKGSKKVKVCKEASQEWHQTKNGKWLCCGVVFSREGLAA